VPYFLVFLGLVVFWAACAFAVLLPMFFVATRYLLPIFWRIWLWGTIGFVAANSLVFVLMLLLLPGLGIAGGPPPRSDFLGALIAGLAVFGPFIASCVGLSAGVRYGWLLGRRIAPAPSASQREPP
jgi:LytS/YehU family sensor histidine kinase